MPEQPISRAVHRAAARVPSYRSVVLRLNRVHCVKSTKEADQDEMALAVLKVHGVVQPGDRVAARTAPGERLGLGKFKNGETRVFQQPKDLARFEYGAPGLEWPRRYFASLMLIEKDQGDLGRFVGELADAMEKDLKKAAMATAAAAGAAIGSAVPLLGTALGAAAGLAVTAGLDAIRKSRAHDLVGVEQAKLDLAGAPGAAGALAGQNDVLEFRGQKAIYRLTCSWEVE